MPKEGRITTKINESSITKQPHIMIARAICARFIITAFSSFVFNFNQSVLTIFRTGTRAMHNWIRH